jgi:hypothetical protein
MTTMDVTFVNAPYDNAGVAYPMDEMRCDNATGANGFRKRRVGCVVGEYITGVGYSRKSYPALASHVSRAQKSGLPGATNAKPLTRTTDQKRIDKNRRLACGKAPKSKTKSCDEYPLASTMQGLAAGGKLRTFPKCLIKAKTGLKGAKGASACMIAKKQNSAQGALMAAFFYDWRVLSGDKFTVLVVK